MTGRLMSCRLRPRVRHGPAAPHLPSPPAHPRLAMLASAADSESHQLDRDMSALGTDNEPDNDHTNTP